MSERTIRRVLIRGQVQGVGFRAFVEDEATILGLEGWVRNLRDGTVEAVFAGAGDVVASMIDLCRQGPEAGHVDEVSVGYGREDDLKLRQPGERFSVLMTA